MLARQEVNLISKIQHPNIVGYKGCHFTQAHCYLVMEFCAGGDLLDTMQSLQEFRSGLTSFHMAQSKDV
jgi:serine/threonine protein kinase